MRTKKSKRRRVARDVVKANAAESAGGGAGNWLNLPEGVREWHPETAGVQRIDIVPYVVTSDAHPDRIEEDCLWYKYPFAVHYSVGVENQAVVCPVSVGQPCPICEEKNRLAKDWEENKEIVRELRSRKKVMYNILDPDDSDRIAVFVFSQGNFADPLGAELQEDDENLGFYDVTKDGKTLKVRFTKASYEGRAYLEATRIDFLQREVMDEDEIVGKTVCLDEVLQVWEYDKLKAEFLQSAAGSSSDDMDDDEDEAPKPKTSKAKSKSKPKKSHDEDEEEDWDEDGDGDEDEESEESEESEISIPTRSLPEPEYRRGSKSKQTPESEDEDDSDDGDWGDDEDDEPEPPPKKKRGPKPKKAAPAVEEDDIPFDDSESEEDEDGEEAEPKKSKAKPKKKAKKKVKKKSKAKPKKSRDEDEDDDWDDDE